MCKRLVCLTTILLLIGPALAGASSPGPVGWWKLDETSGTAAADSVGGNNSVLTGGPVWTTGQFGGALQFDGTDDFATLPIGSLISTLGDSTFTIWANFSNTGGVWQRIFDFGSGSGESPYMFLCPRSGADGPMRFAIRTATVGEQILNAPTTLASGWHNVAASFDSTTMTMKLYVDGDVVASGATELLPKDMGVTTQNWLGKSQWPDALYSGALDELRIYDRALTQDDIKNVVQGGLGYGLASSPVPADKATLVLANQKLSWTAGPVAETHDVYFGTVLDDVLTADSANPKGVAVSKSQSGTSFDPGPLDFGTTYYWRVDEVGAAPDFVIYKGNVWKFTVEPFAYTLGKASIKATASSSYSDKTQPEKTFDLSGLNANDGHSSTDADMWLSAKEPSNAAWIQYEFDQVYSLNEMVVWNSNSAMESVVGYGAMDVTVEYSVDGAAWTSLGNVQFAQAPGEDNYAANTFVDFKDAPVKFVRLTINSNWGGVFQQFGLSEVRFLYIPAKATNLSPVAGALNLESPVAMSWRPGRNVVSHQVYLGTDKDNLPLVATVTEPKYSATVDPDKTYYWKVVEVNEADATPAWESSVLSFTTVILPKDPGTGNLKHLYTFEDGTANDSVGLAHGKLIGGAAVVDGSLVTTAQDQWMEMPGETIAMNTYAEVTVAAWYTPKANANTGYAMLSYFGDSINGLGANGYFVTTARGDNVSRTGISVGNTTAPGPPRAAPTARNTTTASCTLWSARSMPRTSRCTSTALSFRRPSCPRPTNSAASARRWPAWARAAIPATRSGSAPSMSSASTTRRCPLPRFCTCRTRCPRTRARRT